MTPTDIVHYAVRVGPNPLRCVGEAFRGSTTQKPALVTSFTIS